MRPVHTLAASMVRVAAALFCVVIGLGAGYVLWGVPRSGLQEALERVSVENDQLRTRLTDAIRDPNHDVSASLNTILRKLAEQSATIEAQQQSQQQVFADLAAPKPDEQTEEALRACDSAQTKLQQQLETCLFAKAALERAVAQAKKAAAPLPPGRQTVTETIEMPQVPPGANVGKQNKP